VIVFLGPSLAAAEARAIAPCTVLPPARQGDVWRALASRPRAIALIDGVFESHPSVWHHEILDALDAGVAVFGGASMGALRAAELHGRGMVGVGRIFRWVRDGEIIDDADVALLHADAGHEFRALTVPHVNVRWAAQEAVRARVLRRAEAARLVQLSARTFYQRRTWPLLLASLPEQARARWEKWTIPDLKAQDARETIRAAAQAVVSLPVKARQPPPSSLVRRRRLAGELWSLPRARELADAGLRRALIAGRARELGLQPAPGEVGAAELIWLRSLRLPDRGALCARTGLTEADVVRLCEEIALERLMLDHAQRVLNDGPSADEALAAEARLRGEVPPRLDRKR
jgi:hypothetical protein